MGRKAYVDLVVRVASQTIPCPHTCASLQQVLINQTLAFNFHMKMNPLKSSDWEDSKKSN